MLSFRLFVIAESFGALNLYGAAPGAFTDDSITTGEILAQHAAVALAGTTAEQHFAAALASRDVIGQAKGMIMERYHVDAIQAFELLKHFSQHSNTKLARSGPADDRRRTPRAPPQVQRRLIGAAWPAAAVVVGSSRSKYPQRLIGVLIEIAGPGSTPPQRPRSGSVTAGIPSGNRTPDRATSVRGRPRSGLSPDPRRGSWSDRWPQRREGTHQITGPGSPHLTFHL